mmetsp:Transcript_26116/g.62046  ORF Transcript_26116/g.62046 Transcript_26116/m.62046 type:complete len:743 (-) Transcript_26116:254-2482(-)
MKLFHRVKSPANSLGSSSGDGDAVATIKAASTAAGAPSSLSSSVAATTSIQTTNVQVVARIRPLIIKSSDENQSFFHVKSPSSSRRRRLIGLRKKDSKGSSSSSGSTASETLSSSSSSVVSSISDNIFEAWDLTDDDTAKQSSKTEQIKGRTNSYTLDKVFGTTSSTSQIYEQSIQPLVVSAMKGYHSTVLAYGQTSTGKTHTMSGTKDEPGLVPLAVKECFRLVQEGVVDDRQGGAPREYLFRLSYLEVYKEHIRDLLAPTPEPVRLFDGPNGLVIRGLKENVVTTPEQVFEMLRKGEKRRSVGATNMNQHSSRSHAMVRLWIESSTPGEKSSTRVSSLSLVDLAGSESVRLNGTERREEGHYINKSLMTLGQVVLSLSDASAAATGATPNKKKDASHIPYRDSKLTRLLQPSLSGNAQMVLLCCISPLATHLEESHNTFKFATRAKRIEQRAHINKVKDSEETLLQTYREEIEDLRKQLKEAQEQRHLLETRTQPTATTPTSSKVGSSIEATADEINELVEAIQSMEQLILKSRPQDDNNGIKEGPDSTATKKADASLIDSSLAKLLEQDEDDDLLIDDLYHSLPPRSPPSPPTSNRNGKNQVTEDMLHTELTRIRGLLGSVLQKRGVATTSISNLPRRSLDKEFASFPATPTQDENSRLNSAATEVESLKKQLEDQQRSTNLRKADSSFLQSQLKEKDELLVEVSQLLEAVEKRQNELEQENADLKKRLAGILNERIEL